MSNSHSESNRGPHLCRISPLPPLPKITCLFSSLTQHEAQAMLSDKWIQHQRKQNRATLQQWKCCLCYVHTAFPNMEALRSHFEGKHIDHVKEEDRESFCEHYIQACSPKSNRTTTKRLFIPKVEKVRPETPSTTIKKCTIPIRTISATEKSQRGSPHGNSELSNDSYQEERASKRASREEKMSTPSRPSPQPDVESMSSQRVKTHPESVTKVESPGLRRSVGNKSIWVEGDIAPTRSSVDQSNIASVAIAKKRNQLLQHNSRLPAQISSSINSPKLIVPPKSSNTENPRPLASRTAANMLLQPPVVSISQGQLVADIKEIYTALLKVEAECIEVDKKQATLAKDALTSQAAPDFRLKLNHTRVQALISLHRSLLDEYHDFFRTSQHPSACPTLRGLALKYAMPARMWHHGIHSFLEVLRSLLPASLDHMLDFIYLSYSMMALLYETVKAFEETWIECLGDLGRYRMAIENDNFRDKEIWSNVARHWYVKALDKTPNTGRLYHHLAILSRPRALEQLFCYSKSLCASTPFLSARESILTLFEPILKSDKAQGYHRLPSLDYTFVKLHAMLFTNRNMETFVQTSNEFFNFLDVAVKDSSFLEQGCQIALINCFSLLEYGSHSSKIMKLIASSDEDIDEDMKNTSKEPKESWDLFEHVQCLVYSTIVTVLKGAAKDANILPFIHIILVFVLQMTLYPPAINYIYPSIPWDPLSAMFNDLLKTDGVTPLIFGKNFPLPKVKDLRALPEDYALRGLAWTTKFFPIDWFQNDKIDQEEKCREAAYMGTQRRERVLWLAYQIENSSMTPLALKNDSCSFVEDSNFSLRMNVIGAKKEHSFQTENEH